MLDIKEVFPQVVFIRRSKVPDLQERSENADSPHVYIVDEMELDIVESSAYAIVKRTYVDSLDLKEWSEIVANLVKRFQESARDKVSRLLFSNIKNSGKIASIDLQLSIVKHKLSELEKQIEPLNNQLESLIRERDKIQSETTGDIAFIKEKSEKILNDINIINQDPAVSSLHVHSDHVLIWCDGIIITCEEGDRYYLGNVGIAIYPSGMLKVKVSKLHPHVRERGAFGSICLGNLTSVTMELIEKLELAKAFACILSVLRQYNPSDAYRKIYECGLMKALADQDQPDYEDCMRDSNATEHCIWCGDTDCPIHSTRYARCWDLVDKEEKYLFCIACDMCENSQKARAIMEGQ